MSGVPRHLAVAVYEVLACGDRSEALAILSNALEEDGEMPPQCDVCGQRAWPGDTVRHLYSAHHRAPQEVQRVA